MRAFAILATAIGLVAAQSTTTDTVPVSGCGNSIDLIIASCLTTETNTLQACSANDWSCMCAAQQSVVTCYNNCPSDPVAFSAKQQEVSWCNAAKLYDPASTTAVANVAAVTAASSSFSSAYASASASISSASAAAASSKSSTGAAAAPTFVPAGSVLAVVLGVAALL